MSGWEYSTVGEIIARGGGEIKTGPFGTTLKASEYSAVGVPLISVGEVGNGKINVHPKTPRVSPATTARLPEYVLRAGDIVFGRKGAVERSAIVSPEQDGWFLGSDGIRLRLPPTCDARFAALWMQSNEHREWIQRNATGSTMASLNQKIIARIPVPLPSLPEQRAIAATLGALDDKIQLNRKMNATLESMARALFRDWFIDFGPTRAKMEARPPYLSPDLWPLFPDRLDADGKPEGWEVSPLDALAEVTMGISPDGSTYNEDGIGTPLCNGPVEYGDFFLRQIKWTTAPSKLAQRGDLIICVRGSTTGRHAFADAEYCLGRGVASIRGKYDGQEFVETALLSQMNRLLEKTTGSVFPSLSTQDIKKFGLVDPGLPLRQAFCDAVRPMRAKIWANVEESSTLAQTRDLLLPRLMSGELRVAEVERIVREVI